MSKVVHIANLKQIAISAETTTDQAKSRSGRVDNQQLLHVLETVEWALLHNKQKIQSLRRITKVLIFCTVTSWLIIIGALVEKRFETDSYRGDVIAFELSDAKLNEEADVKEQLAEFRKALEEFHAKVSDTSKSALEQSSAAGPLKEPGTNALSSMRNASEQKQAAN